MVFRNLAKKCLAAFISASVAWIPVPHDLAFASEPIKKKTVPTTASVPVSKVAVSRAISKKKTVPTTASVPVSKVVVSRATSKTNSSTSTDFLTQGSDSLSTKSSSTGSWGQSYDDYWWRGSKGVNAESAWKTSTGEGVLVAVLDTGVNSEHPDLISSIYVNEVETNGLPGRDDDGNGYVDDIKGHNFAALQVVNPTEPGNSDLTQDRMGHGTHVASLIAGKKGIAPKAKILPVKVLDDEGSGGIKSIVDGIFYAVRMGAKIINLSLGAIRKLTPQAERDEFANAVQYAKKQGSFVVVAGGNDAASTKDTIPASFSASLPGSSIAVGAVDETQKRADFSNTDVDFVAPGKNIMAARSLASLFPFFGSPGATWHDLVLSGTSMATPIISGIIALLLSKFPNISFDQVYAALKGSAKDLGRRGRDTEYGWGLPNAALALAIAAKNFISNRITNSAMRAANTPFMPTAGLTPTVPALLNLPKGVSAFSPSRVPDRRVQVAVNQIFEKYKLKNKSGVSVALSPESRRSLSLPMNPPAQPNMNEASLAAKLPYLVSLGENSRGYEIPRSKWGQAVAADQSMVRPGHPLYEALAQAVAKFSTEKIAKITFSQTSDTCKDRSCQGKAKVQMRSGIFYNFDTALVAVCAYVIKLGKTTYTDGALCIDDTKDVYPLNMNAFDRGERHDWYAWLSSTGFSAGSSLPETQPGWGAGPQEDLSGCKLNTGYKAAVLECPTTASVPGTVAISIEKGSVAHAVVKIEDVTRLMSQVGVKPLWMSLPPSAYDPGRKETVFFIRFNPDEASNKKVAQAFNDATRGVYEFEGMTASAAWSPLDAVSEPPTDAGAESSSEDNFSKPNLPVVAFGSSVANQNNTNLLQTLKDDIRAAINNVEDNEIYQTLIVRVLETLDPAWINTYVQGQKQRASDILTQMSPQAVDLKKIVGERANRSDAFEKRAVEIGYLPQEFTFGEKSKKTASQILKEVDLILENSGSHLKKVETEASSDAQKVKSNLNTQKMNWKSYFDKLIVLAKKADARNANPTLLRSEFEKIKKPESGNPTPPPPTMKNLLNSGTALNYFFSNRIWHAEFELLRARLQRRFIELSLLGSLASMHHTIERIDNFTYDTTLRNFLKLRNAAEFFEQVKNRLSPQLKAKVQPILNKYQQLNLAFPKKREALIKYVNGLYRSDGWREALGKARDHEMKWAQQIERIRTGDFSGPSPERPRLLTTTGNEFAQLTVTTQDAPTLEPFDSEVNIGPVSWTLMLKIAFELPAYPYQGGVGFSEIKKSNLNQKNPPTGWPLNFVIQDEQTATKFFKEAHLGTLQFSFYNGNLTGDSFSPPTILIVTMGKNTITDLEVVNGKLRVTLTDDPTLNSNKLPVHIVRVEDVGVASAIAGGAPIEYVHVPA